MAANEDNDGLFDLQLIIDPTIFSQSGLLQQLHAVGEFEINVPQNRLYLPLDRELAAKLGCSQYAAKPLESYTMGMVELLSMIELSPDGQGAMRGDPAATARALEAVLRLRDTVKVALINGDLVLAV